MRKIRLIRKILRDTGADRILLGFLGFLLLSALVIWLCESGIHTYREALWYCFAVVTTIGFGDLTPTTSIGRVLSVILGLYGIVVVALITSIIVNFYGEMKKESARQTVGEDRGEDSEPSC